AGHRERRRHGQAAGGHATRHRGLRHRARAGDPVVRRGGRLPKRPMDGRTAGRRRADPRAPRSHRHPAAPLRAGGPGSATAGAQGATGRGPRAGARAPGPRRHAPQRGQARRRPGAGPPARRGGRPEIHPRKHRRPLRTGSQDMEAKLGKAEKKAFRIANLLDDAADAIRKQSRRAYRAGEISLEEYMEARAKELELRAEVSVVVATDLSGVLEEVAEAGGSIERAIREATDRIDSASSVRSGFETITALVGLVGALASGDAKLVLKAGKAF